MVHQKLVGRQGAFLLDMLVMVPPPNVVDRRAHRGGETRERARHRVLQFGNMPKRIVNGEIVDDAGTTRASSHSLRGKTRLIDAHRSVRQAHAISLVMITGILVLWLPFLTILLGTSWRIPLLLLAGFVYQARYGAAWIHGIVPRLVQEGMPPSPQDVAQSSPGVFALDAISDPSGRVSEEWESFLENLAFTCTYGKTNCLTSQMYSGRITLGKIISLVGDKLGQGVIACR